MRSNQQTNDYYEDLLTVGPFGGLDTTTSPYYVSPTNFVDGENFVPNAGYGGYYTAEGRTVFLAAPLPSQPDGIGKITVAGVDHYVFAVTVAGVGKLYQAVAGGVPAPLVTPVGLTPNQQTVFASAGQWLFLTNGVDIPLKIDITFTVTYWGIVKPATAPILTLSGAGAMGPGVYYYCITFGNAVQESSQGTVSLPITVPISNGVTLTGIPISPDPQVTQRNIYRLGGSLGEWLLVAIIPDNVTTTYTDTQADAALDGQLLVVFRDPPPPFKYIVAYYNLIWGFNLPGAHSTVWFSNVNEPWGFNSDTSTLSCQENSFGDDGVGLLPIGTNLVCLKNKSYWTIIGTDAATFQAVPGGQIGCISSRSIASAYGIGAWESREGVFLHNGLTPVKISDGQYQQSNIKSVLDGFDDNDMSQSVGFWQDNMYFLSFPTVLKTYFWDTRTSQWFRLGWSCTQVLFDPEDPVNVIASNPQSVGEIDQWFNSPLDLGNTMNSYLTTRITDAPNTKATKDYEAVIVEAPSQAGQKAAIRVIVNPGDEKAFYDVDVSLFSDPTQFTRANRYLVRLPKTLMGNEVQVTIRLFTMQRTIVNKVGVVGKVKRLMVSQG
jgi:hypothetical protein